MIGPQNILLETTNQARAILKQYPRTDPYTVKAIHDQINVISGTGTLSDKKGAHSTLLQLMRKINMAHPTGDGGIIIEEFVYPEVSVETPTENRGLLSKVRHVKQKIQSRRSSMGNSPSEDQEMENFHRRLSSLETELESSELRKPTLEESVNDILDNMGDLVELDDIDRISVDDLNESHNPPPSPTNRDRVSSDRVKQEIQSRRSSMGNSPSEDQEMENLYKRLSALEPELKSSESQPRSPSLTNQDRVSSDRVKRFAGQLIDETDNNLIPDNISESTLQSSQSNQSSNESFTSKTTQSNSSRSSRTSTSQRSSSVDDVPSTELNESPNSISNLPDAHFRRLNSVIESDPRSNRSSRDSSRRSENSTPHQSSSVVDAPSPDPSKLHTQHSKYVVAMPLSSSESVNQRGDLPLHNNTPSVDSNQSNDLNYLSDLESVNSALVDSSQLGSLSISNSEDQLSGESKSNDTVDSNQSNHSEEHKQPFDSNDLPELESVNPASVDNIQPDILPMRNMGANNENAFSYTSNSEFDDWTSGENKKPSVVSHMLKRRKAKDKRKEFKEKQEGDKALELSVLHKGDIPEEIPSNSSYSEEFEQDIEKSQEDREAQGVVNTMVDNFLEEAIGDGKSIAGTYLGGAYMFGGVVSSCNPVTVLMVVCVLLLIYLIYLLCNEASRQPSKRTIQANPLTNYLSCV